MGELTFSELRHGLRRFVAPAIAIILGVAFVAATFTLSSTMQRTVERTATEQVSGYSAVVSDRDRGAEPLTAAQLAQARAIPGVTRVGVEQTGVVPARGSGATQSMQASTARASGLQAVSGSSTAGPGQVLLSSEAAAALGARPGSTVTIGGSPGTAERRTVAGVVRVEGKDGRPLVIGSSAQITSWSGRAAYDAILVAGGTSSTLAEQLRTRLGDGVTVRAAQQEIDFRVSEMVTGIRFITTFFGMFAVVALFVAGMVIANTFQILLAQRSRQLALLRCVGASRGQVTRAVLGESMGLGLIASALGVALGVGVVWVFTTLSDRLQLTQLPMDRLGISAGGLTPALLLGVVITVLSALRPARRAAAVAPLAALAPLPAPAGGTRASRIRLAIGSVVAAVGFGGLLLGALAGQAGIAVPAGLLSFLGVVLTAPVVVPALARRAGRLAAATGGVPGELATDNTVRNPRRTAATSTALLVGITLMATMLVGAATSKAVIDQAVDQQFALDAQVTSKTPIPDSVRRQLEGLDGIEQSAALRTTRARINGPQLSFEQTVVGVPDSARGVLRNDGALAGLRDGRVLIDRLTAADFGIADGSPVRVHGAAFTARLTDGDTEGFVLTERDLRRVAPNAPVATVWLRLTADADPAQVMGSIRQAAAPSGAEVGGAVGARAQLDQMVSLMLLIVSALLGVAVLIALVGVGNTLGLSVLERQRETALLRALGFTSGQVRRTLAIEALLVALVAAVVGTVLGVVYGWAGARSLLGTYAEGALPQIPWTGLGALLLAAAGCGLLASLAPARRAARTSPVAALAAD